MQGRQIPRNIGTRQRSLRVLIQAGVGGHSEPQPGNMRCSMRCFSADHGRHGQWKLRRGPQSQNVQRFSGCGDLTVETLGCYEPREVEVGTKRPPCKSGLPRHRGTPLSGRPGPVTRRLNRLSCSCNNRPSTVGSGSLDSGSRAPCPDRPVSQEPCRNHQVTPTSSAQPRPRKSCTAAWCLKLPNSFWTFRDSPTEAKKPPLCRTCSRTCRALQSRKLELG